MACYNQRSAPRFVLLELTHRCNLHCIHCYNDSDNFREDLDDSRRGSIWLKNSVNSACSM